MALASLTGCKKEAGAEGGFRVNGTWRYKMTVTVETPEGLKSGSAVREISSSNSKYKLKLPESGSVGSLKGAAIVVDLGEHGKLFALLRGEHNVDLGKNIVPKVWPYEGGYTSIAGIKYYREFKAGKTGITLENYPMLVMFKNINDPKTVTRVLEVQKIRNPSTAQDEYLLKADHFEELFGRGVKLKEITIETTDEPVTWNIDSILPWLKNIKANIDGTSSTNSTDLANQLHVGDFRTGKQ